MVLAIGDGATTYNFTSGSSPYVLLEEHFEPTMPPITPSEATLKMESGADLDGREFENVLETIRALVMGAASEIRGFINGVETGLFLAAEYATKKRGDPWYLYFDPIQTDASNSLTYRSQILYGNLSVIDSDFDNGYAVIELTVRRRWYWEGAQTELSLSSSHGSGTYGAIIYNDDDATYDDFVTISGAQVDGVIPSPVRVEYTNEWTSRVDDVYTSLAVWGATTPATVRHAAGDATSLSSTWSGDAETRLGYWELTSSELDDFAGRYYRVLHALTSSPLTDTWARLRVQIPANSPLTTVYEGDLVLLNSGRRLQDLGVIQLPPWLRGVTGLQSLAVSLYARKTGGGSLYTDYLKILPAETFRSIVPVGYGNVAGTTLVDDQIEDELWNEVATDSSDKTGNFYVRGKKQYVWPGRDATFYVKVISSSGTPTDTINGALRVYYRPRRLSI